MSTLTVDALLLVVVCLLYGFAERLFVPGVAIVVVGATYVLDHLLFFAGSAHAVYAGSVASGSADLSPTLSMGVTIDHVFSMSVPLAGGALWKAFGYESSSGRGRRGRRRRPRARGVAVLIPDPSHEQRYSGKSDNRPGSAPTLRGSSFTVS